MPHNRHVRAMQRHEEQRQNGHYGPLNGHYHQPVNEDRENRDPNVAYCCLPAGCDRYYDDPIHVNDPHDAVKVFCNNENCTVGSWMHASCFQEWQQHVLSYLRSCGRARSWSEKQRLQNLWTKKGYDLAYKACDCKCGRGHLRKDLDYYPPPKDDRRQKKHKHRAQQNQNQNQPHQGNVNQNKVLPNLHKMVREPVNPVAAAAAAAGVRPQLRVRTSSFSSTGSSPPSSAGTPPLTPGGASKKSKFEFFADADQAAAGNIFRRRADFTAFNVLPRHQQNPYHIKMEDEGPYGNDEIRCFVLSNLSTHQVTKVNCVSCNIDLPVFDRYPLIDGTFFLSPQRYNTDLQVLSESKLLYLNACCMRCLEGSRNIRCQACRKPWTGRTLVLGTMYAYDIFASQPCCAFRTSCKNCKRPMLDPDCGFNFYSEYSRQFDCPHCRARDYHFIKPLNEAFYIKQPICKS